MQDTEEKILRYVEFHSEAYGAPVTRCDFVNVLHLNAKDVDETVEKLLAENKIKFWKGRYIEGYILPEKGTP